IREQSDDGRCSVRRINGDQSALLSACSRDTIKRAVASKRDATETIETGVSDKGCALVRDVNQPESPPTGGIIAAGRAIKKSRGSWQDIYHPCHANSAVREAEVIIGAGVRKCMLVHRPKVGKDSLIAVRIVRGTEL